MQMKILEFKNILFQVVEILLNYLEENQEKQTKVIDYQKAELLKEKLDLSLPINGITAKELIPLIQSYLRYSTRTGSKKFFNLLFSGFSLPGILGELVSSATNTTMHTYEVAPVATLMEFELIQALNNLVGFNQGEGLMVTGGSNANLIGMLCARNKFFPEAKYKGLGNQKLVAFISDQAHYSWLKAANILGIGIDNVVKIKTDDGCMIPEQLETAINHNLNEGKIPFFVGATAGTTVLGAFDHLPLIAEISKKYGLWLHVDGAWGAPVLFSKKHQHLLTGSHLANSFTWDAHKLMGVPLISSVFLVKEKGILQAACSGGGTDYLFHNDENCSYNLGEMSLQCGRKVDSLKLWLSWQYYGYRGYEKRINYLFQLANYAAKYISNSENLQLLAQPKFLNICFRYTSEQISINPKIIDEINSKIRQKLLELGAAMINYAYHQERIIIRLILANSEVTQADLDDLFQKIITLGKNYELEYNLMRN